MQALFSCEDIYKYELPSDTFEIYCDFSIALIRQVRKKVLDHSSEQAIVAKIAAYMIVSIVRSTKIDKFAPY